MPLAPNALSPVAGTTAHPRRESAAFRLLALAYRQHAAGIFVNLAACTGVAAQVASTGHPWAWYWLLGVGMVSVARLGLHVAFGHRFGQGEIANRAQRRRWQLAHEAGLLTAAVLWAGFVWTALPTQPTEGQYLILIVVSALASGATGVLAPLHGAARLYICILFVPPCIQLSIMQPGQPVLATLGGLFMVVMLIGHRNNRQMLLRSLALQEENAGLVTSLRAQNDRVQHLNASLERRVAERTEALHTMASHDSLTGLHNRRGMLQRIEQQIDNQAGAPTVLLFLDLDRFKQINDGLGHDVGDAVLKEVADRFAACLPADATIGRWGGDEFVVVTDLAAGDEHCGAVARALGASVLPPIEIEGEQLHVGVSIGIAIHPQDGATPTALIRAADLAATEVKKTGRGQIRFYDHTLSEVQRRRVELSLGLRDAIAQGSLRIAYQPIVGAADGEVISLEALLRWQHPTLGTIRPDEFIPIAEDSDRIVELGAWVLRRACLDAVVWGEDLRSQKVAVNVSVRQLLTPGFVQVVTDALGDSGLLPARLALEVTESVFDEQHTALTLRTLGALHRLGVSIHIDDFGTGYSSLSRLHEFPIDAIKIDRSFVANLDGQARTIIEGAIMIAHRFGLGVIAEGVETPAQAQTLWAMGVDSLQGYLIGKPAFTPQWQPVRAVWAAPEPTASARIATPRAPLANR